MDSSFWRYKAYADIRGVLEFLCEFSLDIRMPVLYAVLVTLQITWGNSRLEIKTVRKSSVDCGTDLVATENSFCSLAPGQISLARLLSLTFKSSF